jgi:S-adenosylmethionine:tRNA ribosyltransferase-isomerase
MDRELLVLEKHSYDNDWYRHRVLYRGKLDKGDVLSINGSKIMIDEVQDGGLAIVKSDQDLLKLTDQYGEVPLPPYMHRRAIPLDITRYQTIWGSERGSVAAPTASLNMTDDILTTLKDKGVIIVFLTLHVGLGTFLPIRTDNIEDHHMHKEYFQIPQNTIRVIQNAKANNRRVVALGTTVARTLEYAGEQLKNTPADLTGEADIFIYPGYKFKVVDSLMTNFHAPKSTVLMLTAAFAGWDKLLPAYNHAVESGYSFLSYGDSMLIL